MRPMIVIVGRPNVGKSTLLNRLAGRRVAVVDAEPGVTRDRIFVECKLADREVVLVDTGGLDPSAEEELARSAVDMAHLAVEEADLILFLCDGGDGLRPLDTQVADVLRKSGKPLVCLVNKCDPGSGRDELEFHELGLDFLPISAAHGSGLNRMAELVDERLREAGDVAGPGPDDPVRPLKLCLLGRPNVGKSLLANSLAGQQRQIVSRIAGTTRDAVDIPITCEGSQFMLVDTPGVRRRSRISERLERYSVVAALRSLERADVAVVVLDGVEPFADQDARLLRLAHDRGRALVVAVNKSDLWDGDGRRAYLDRLKHGMRFVDYAAVIVLSALTGEGTRRLLPEVRRAFDAAGVRIGTGDLNRLVEDALERQQPPLVRGRRGKIFYVTQAGTHPPTFVAWVNDPHKFSVSYLRYLDHRLRERFAFRGTPLRLVLRARKKNGSRSGSKRNRGRRR